MGNNKILSGNRAYCVAQFTVNQIGVHLAEEVTSAAADKKAIGLIQFISPFTTIRIPMTVTPTCLHGYPLVRKKVESSQRVKSQEISSS
jgi:hypothetical protein